MPFLSVSLRILAILAAAVTVIVFVQGGNQLKTLKSELDRERAVVRAKTSELEDQSAKYNQIKSEFDKTTLELATMKRDERLRKNETLLAQQEVEKIRSQLSQTESQKIELAEINESLRRENIDLKARSYDSSADPRRLQSKIETQMADIRQLEQELKDTQMVLQALLDGDQQKTQFKGPLERHVFRKLFQNTNCW
jgi:chromosome segregation ATPase